MLDLLFFLFLLFAPILGSLAFFLVSLCLFVVARKSNGANLASRRRMLIASVVTLTAVTAFYIFVAYTFRNAMISM